MIGYGDEKTTVYHGHYKPAELYGPKMVQTTGKNLFDISAVTGAGGTSSEEAIYSSTGHVRGDTLIADVGLYGSYAIWKGCIIEVQNDCYMTVSADVVFPSASSDAGTSILLGYYYWNRNKADFYTRGVQAYDSRERFSVSLPVKSGDRLSVLLQATGNAGCYRSLGIEFSNVQVEIGSRMTDYEPYSGGVPGMASVGTVRYAGWKEVEESGQEIIVEDTYDDRLDLMVHGKHSQYQQDEVSALYSGDYFSFQSGENSYLKSAVVAGSHSQKSGYAIKWNQLIPAFAFAKRIETLNGVTITPSEDGTYTLNGTATARVRHLIVVSNSRGHGIKGHKCIMRGCPPGGSRDTYYMDGYGCDYDIGKGYIGGCSFDYRTIIVESGTTVENLVFQPEIIDLTEMFGTGNEPASIEEFKALFPENFYPQNLGEYRLAPEGYTTAYGTPSVYLPQEVIPVTRETLCVHGKNLASEEGWSAVNTRTPIALENHRFTISYTGARDVAYQKVFYVKAGCQYTFSLYAEFDDDNENNPPVVIASDLYESWYSSNTVNRVVRRSGGKEGRYTVTFVPSSDTIRVAISLTSYTNGISGTSSFWNMQLEEGNAATDYEPYEAPQHIEHELPLYGDDDCKDTFDFVTGVETQRWDRIVFTGAESWYQYGSVVALAVDYPAKIHHWKDNIGELCSLARYSEEGNTAVIPGFFTTYRPAADVKGWIIFHEEIDVSEWKAYLSRQYEAGTPVYVVYPLEEPRCRKQAVGTIPLLPNTGVVVESNPGLQQSEVVVEPQMPSPQYPSEIEYLDGCKVWSSGKNLFNPYEEINYSLYAYHATQGGKNKADKNGNILVWNGSNGFLYGQQWKGLPAGVYTASFDVVDKGDAKGGIYAGLTKNGKFASYNSSGGMGHHVYHVEITENDWFCLFFGFSGATMKVTEKPIVFANVQLERGTEATTYMPYFTPSQQELPFELFGNGEVNDTCEPCVLVDGEWKCRVTRRWWKVDLEKYRDILVGIYKKKDDVTCFTISQLGLYTSEPAKTAGWQTSICSHFKNVNGSYDRFVPGLYSDQPSLTGMYFTVEGIKTVEEFRQWYIENKVVTMYQTAKPVVELYDPLPLRTIPRYTHISNDAGAGMSAKLKVVGV